MADYSYFEPDLMVEVKDKVMTLTLNNPDELNANTPHMHRGLTQIWDEIGDDNDVHVVVITGAGRAFSAGGNVKNMQKTIDDKGPWWKTEKEARRIIFRMLEFDKPVIARVNGHAVGFGCTVALCADIVIASERARFGDPHVGVGLVAGDGGALLWPARIGFTRAKEYLLTGEQITAPEAVEIGLINHAVPPEELDEKVYGLARKLASGAIQSIRWTKEVLNAQLRQTAHAVMDLGMARETLSVYQPDHQEAVRAFAAKETPRFKGE